MADSPTYLLPDEELWHRFTQGHEPAFEQLFTRFYPKLYQYGRKFSPDTEFIKDAIQELFTELWQRRTHLGLTPAVRQYLYKSLRRKMLRLAGSGPVTSPLTDEADQFAVGLSPEQTLLADEDSAQQHQQLERWLSLLTPRQREALYLRYHQDMDNDEIAAVMNVGNHAVRNLIYEALKLLRTRYLFPLSGLILLWCFS